MQELSIVLSLALAALVIVLAGFSAVAFGALVKGCTKLRRNLSASSQDFSSLLLKSPLVPGVSVILAPSDASPETRVLVRRLLDLHFGKHELVLVLDGPSPLDLERWTQELNLSRQEHQVPDDLPSTAIRGCYVSSDPIRLLVVDKEPGGIEDALNAGVNAAQYPVIGMVDQEADFIPEFLLHMIRPMLEDWDRTVAVCGVAPPPPASGLAGCIGTIEALRLWLVRCAAFSAWNKLLPVPGACLLVKRDAICSAGGFRAGPLELFVDLHSTSRATAAPWRIALVAAPVSVRPAAGNWDHLHRQARGDQRQLAAALGKLGGAARQFFGLFCMRALRPLLETVALILALAGWIAGMVPPALAALVLVTSIGGGIVISMAVVVLREVAGPSGLAPARLGALFLAAIPENLGYRQLRNLWMIGGYFGAPVPQKRNRGHAVQDRAPAIEIRKS